MMLALHPQWNNLIDWLKSHGMSSDELPVQARIRQGVGYSLYATRPIPPSTPLFTIPASALPNVLTLAPHYPGSGQALTAVQLISLHLALHRPKAGECSSDPLFGPYISVLPEDFAFHPLTWLRKRVHGTPSVDHEKSVLNTLPLSVVKKLKGASAKFETDWKRVSDYLRGNSRLLELFNRGSLEESEIQFLWAWLNVNTRCIYHRVRTSPTDPDNISLCPLLDFANHVASGPHMKPASKNDTQRPRLLKAGDITLVSPAELNVEENEEMHLIYGGHSNKTLFVEYGFVVRFSPEALCNGQFFGEVDVQDLVENLFQQREETGERMRDILVKEGYWGDWTMQSAPAPAHPSFRLISALRLYHALEATVNSEPFKDEVHLWLETILGTREYISEDNEALWRGTMVKICERVEASAKRGLLQIQGEISGEWKKEMRENIGQLWEEELWVVRCVKTSVEEGIAF